MSTNPNSKKKPRTLLGHLASAPTEVNEEAQSLTSKLPAIPEAPREDYRMFNCRVTIENDLALNRAKFWLNGKTKQDLVNDALTYYLAQFPESKKPLPNELPR